MREHLENWERQTGQSHPMLSGARSLPAGCEQLWRDFIALSGTRGSTGFGPSRISFSDIDAFQRVKSVTLPAWQIEAIRRADNAFLAHYAESNKPKGKKRG